MGREAPRWIRRSWRSWVVGSSVNDTLCVEFPGEFHRGRLEAALVRLPGTPGQKKNWYRDWAVCVGTVNGVSDYTRLLALLGVSRDTEEPDAL